MSFRRYSRDVTERRDPIQEFADKIVAELEKGVKPWDEGKCAGPQAPINGATGDHYHGINVLILGMDMRAFRSGDPRWQTYKQAQEKGCKYARARKPQPSSFTSRLRSRTRRPKTAPA